MVPLAPQQVASQLPHPLFIVHDEDGLGSSGRLRFALGFVSRGSPGLDHRQVDLEDRALAGLAVRPHVTAVLLHRAVHRREPQAGAFAGRLGGVERLEDPLQRLAVHPVSGIGHRQHHVPARDHRHVRMSLQTVRPQLGVPALDQQVPSLRHRVAGVEDQVHQHLLQLALIGFDEAGVGCQTGFQDDSLAAQRTQHRHQVVEQRAQVHLPRANHLPLGEGQQLAGEVG